MLLASSFEGAFVFFLLWLTLSCKLIIPEPVGPDTTLADCIRLQGDNMKEFAIRVSSEEKVLELFSEAK